MKQPDKEKLLFIDIETATGVSGYDALDETWQSLWDERVGRMPMSEQEPAVLYEQRAGVMAEFSRIICISIGYFSMGDAPSFRVRSYAQADEKKLLLQFLEETSIFFKNGIRYFAGHNIREFDIPFICRRLMVNGLAVPLYLNFQQVKPWDVPVVDTFQLWRFGDYKNFTSLKLLSAVLNVPSPKDDINGSMVGKLYWQGDARQRLESLKRITRYCEKDIVATANVFLRLIQHPTLEECGIEIVYA
jgi:uncharacterized protein YprB with RNaseH-like and TPR domain